MGNQNNNFRLNNNNNSQNNNSNDNSSNENVINEENNSNNQLNNENQAPPSSEATDNGENGESQSNENLENSNDNNAPPVNGNIDNSDCPVPANLNDYKKHFSFNGLMGKIKESAKKAGLKAIYMALLLYYALESPTISTMDKAIIYGALGYFITPIDIIPDILPVIGLSDDIAILAWAFSRVKHNVTDLTREKAKTKLKIWFGNFDEKEIDDLWELY